uniref:hemopexin-like isoform X2 n=1 Tax=Doryrhamphus excisus TaxID=161450 RepID=UPI0025AE090C|nr:hemopexin-like isoform X2 [Doryrhamphus excisus]
MKPLVTLCFLGLALHLTAAASVHLAAHTAGDELPKACEHHRDSVQTTSPEGYPIVGAFVPQCDANGQYTPQQCHGSSGHCWCVDNQGQERPGTRTPPGTTPTDCDKPGPKSHCEHHRDSVQTTSPEGYPIAGAFVPQCDANGQYTPQQCHGSSGHCWCVDSQGQERPGTRTPPGTARTVCDKPEGPKSHCEHHRDSVQTTSPEGYPIVGAFVPQCDANGQYTPQQCHGSSGHCWCVDSQGQERPGSRTPPGTTPTVCDNPVPDRCDGIEFDAITPDEKGNTLFFKGGHLWEGFHGPARLSSESFKELGPHVDAALRMHDTEKPDHHDHIYFFLGDKVFRYYDRSLEDGYPKPIQDDFPGVPSHLDAAVECPKGECASDSVLFFKGQDVHVYDISTKSVKTKTWSELPACTSALRWLEHYYCFHGNNFTRFHPVTGHVNASYPKDARRYFMTCPNFGHGGDYKVPKCSQVQLDAITTDDAGKKYIFTGEMYMRLDTQRDGWHAFPISRNWKAMTGRVDAVFSYSDKIYMIKGEEVFIYKQEAHYTLIQGYPKSLREELGIQGRVDAAFLCPNEHTVHIIQGSRMLDVDLNATPRAVTRDIPLPLSEIDAARCGPDGVDVFRGHQYYRYPNAFLLAVTKIAPVPLDITPDMMGCRS